MSIPYKSTQVQRVSHLPECEIGLKCAKNCRNKIWSNFALNRYDFIIEFVYWKSGG